MEEPESSNTAMSRDPGRDPVLRYLRKLVVHNVFSNLSERTAMKNVLLLAMSIFILCSRPPFAVDLTKIDRGIGRQPAYKSAPKYCLIVLGPDAKTRIWLVIDDNRLYVDRNGNGDLTDRKG